MTIRVAINGFGRIGRLALRGIVENLANDIEVVAIHSRGTPKQMGHLLQYDSVHGRLSTPVTAGEDYIAVGEQHCRIFTDLDMTDLPWAKYGIDVVFECTGQFNARDKCQGHLHAGAKRVLVSAPCKDADATIVYGVNHDILRPEHRVISNASCTTNCAAPICKVLNDALGIEYANMTTIHAATGDQPTVDSRHKSSLRRSRAAFQSMIPTSTGAGRTMHLIIPALKDRMDGTAIRVPVTNVSLIDLTAQVRQDASVEEINALMQQASQGALAGVLDYTDEELVSCDFVHHTASAIFDATCTKRFGKDLLRVLAWYDNEWAFSLRMLDMARLLAA